MAAAKWLDRFRKCNDALDRRVGDKRKELEELRRNISRQSGEFSTEELNEQLREWQQRVSIPPVSGRRPQPSQKPEEGAK